MLPQPANPSPAHASVDGMLSRKFGREVANYFSGSPLNRVGFLRTDHVFLRQALQHPSTSFLLCNELQPLVQPHTAPAEGKLAYVKYADVQPVIGEQVFERSEKDVVDAFDSREYAPQIVFLGIDEQAPDGLTYQGKNRHTGAPFFALDVTPRRGGSVQDACERLIAEQKRKGFDFGRGRIMDVVAGDAAIYAEARQLLDWNARNPFCAGCGQPSLSLNAGFKRTCPPSDRSSGSRGPCPTRKGISNLSFPRTDPTVIMAVLSSAGTHILLGRQARWPPRWYSTLAGFAEPAESLEEAVRREVFEEAGVHVARVVLHSSQPWPYPANLMIGAVAQAVPGMEQIDLGNDPELEDAKWFPLDEVREALARGTSGIDTDRLDGYPDDALRLPPSTAIANQLMQSVCNGFAGGEAKM